MSNGLRNCRVTGILGFERVFPAFALAKAARDDLNHRVRFGGWGRRNPRTKRLAMTAHIAAKPTEKAGEAAAHVQAVPPRGAAKGRCGRRSSTF